MLSNDKILKIEKLKKMRKTVLQKLEQIDNLIAREEQSEIPILICVFSKTKFTLKGPKYNFDYIYYYPDFQKIVCYNREYPYNDSSLGLLPRTIDLRYLIDLNKYEIDCYGSYSEYKNNFSEIKWYLDTIVSQIFLSNQIKSWKEVSILLQEELQKNYNQEKLVRSK